jgi:hypothetical protein
MTRLVTTLLLVLAVAPSVQAGPYDDLLKLVPPNTNTLVLLDVKAAFASPLAKSEKWADNYFHRYRAGIGFVPSDAEAVVVASEVDLAPMTRDYQIGLVKVRNQPNIKDLAARVGGTTDEIGGQLATLSPQDVYYIALPGSVLAGVYPANRQAASRWMRQAKAAKEANLSPYLKRAAGAAEGDVLTIAVDLKDSGDPTLLRRGLPASPAVVRQKIKTVEPLSKFVASVEGVTLSVKVADGITATVRVDFGFEVDLYKRIAPELFLEVLDQYGVSVPGMSAWPVTFGERSMTMSGSLRTADLRRILSLFAFPGPTDEDEPKVNPKEASVGATKRYMAAVDVILTDLRNIKDSPDYVKSATWNEKAAAQLDQLSKRGVDQIAVLAAYDASRRLRALAGSLRGVPISMDALASKAYVAAVRSGVMSGGGGWWGLRSGGVMFDLESNVPKLMAEQRKTIEDDRQRRSDIWIQIDELLVDARQKLFDKYKTRF